MFTVYFHLRYKENRFKSIVLPLLDTAFWFYHTWLYIRLVNVCGGVDKNPDPKTYSVQYLTIWHWNLNSIAVHNFIKVSLLKAYFSVHDMDVVCVFETYIESSVPIDDGILRKSLVTASLGLTIYQTQYMVEF